MDELTMATAAAGPLTALLGVWALQRRLKADLGVDALQADLNALRAQLGELREALRELRHECAGSHASPRERQASSEASIRVVEQRLAQLEGTLISGLEQLGESLGVRRAR